MSRNLAVPALLAVCLLAGCNKSEPETAATPTKDTTATAAAPEMAKDTTTAMDTTAMKVDSSAMKTDSMAMPMDTTMAMPADSTKQ